MSRFRTSAAAAFALLLCGCGLISFERLSVTVWPSQREAILPAATPLWVEFPSSPDRPSVQRLFTLSSPDGQVSGDFRWDDRRMYFDAVPALRPGVRYVLAFRGRVTLENGQAFDADEEVPFYVGHLGPGPALLSVDPADGSVVAVGRPLVLSFSAPIDPDSFAREFDVQPSTETLVTWDLSSRVVTIAPREAWTNLATYSWMIGKDMAAPDGTPTGIEYAGRFRVQADSTAPAVISILPGIRATLSPTGNDLEHVSADDALLFTFSEDVRTDSLSSTFTSTPAIKGTLLRVSAGVYALIPDARLVMGQRYTLRIGATVEDLSGNKLAFPYERSFTPDIPLQTVLSIKAVYASTEDEWSVFNTLDAKPVSIDVTGILDLVIRFAEAFSVESGARLVSAITLDGFFPGSTADPSIVSALWTGGRTLSLVYSGLEKGTPDAGNYYKLTLPGGAVSSDNGSGSFLKEDVWLYFTTRP
jgi:hypothetical protein